VRLQNLRPIFSAVSDGAVNAMRARLERGEQFGKLERVEVATLALASIAIAEEDLWWRYQRMERGIAGGEDVRLAFIFTASLFRSLGALNSLASQDQDAAAVTRAYEDLLGPFLEAQLKSRKAAGKATEAKQQEAADALERWKPIAIEERDKHPGDSNAELAKRDVRRLRRIQAEKEEEAQTAGEIADAPEPIPLPGTIRKALPGLGLGKRKKLA
jgi:hypothetical protein